MTERTSRQRSTRGSRVTLLGDDDLHYFKRGAPTPGSTKSSGASGHSGPHEGLTSLSGPPTPCPCRSLAILMPGIRRAIPSKHAGDQASGKGFWADVGEGAVYKYHIVSRYHDYHVDKADPYGFAHEVGPAYGIHCHRPVVCLG